MKTLRPIMRHGFLFMLQRDTTVADACRIVAAHDVGIVAVLNGERLCGVFSERDVVRRVVDGGSNPLVRDSRMKTSRAAPSAMVVRCRC